MVLLPLLTRFCRLEDKKAFATSLSVILPICLTSLCVYWLRGDLALRESLPYLLGGAAGGVIAGLLFSRVSAVFLHRALGLVILWGGLRLVTA